MTFNSDAPTQLQDQMEHELARLKKDWWWFFLLGMGLIVAGTVALGSAYFIGIVTVVLFGILLLAGGVAQVITAFWAGKWSGFLMHLLIGVFYAVAGMLIVDAPKDALATLTLLIAAFLIVSGIFRIATALSLQFNNWGWVLLNGAVTLLLGILIYRQWPTSGEWAIGLFIGIEMLFNGLTWMMTGLSLRQLAQAAEREEAPHAG